jgi:hypothetical protein
MLRAHSFVAEPLDDEDLDLKEEYIRQGFPEWSRRDFQQLIRGMETYGWCVSSFYLFIYFLVVLTDVVTEGVPTRRLWPGRFRTRLLRTSRNT